MKKQLEVDFAANKGSRQYYIQSAYAIAKESLMSSAIAKYRKINTAVQTRARRYLF